MIFNFIDNELFVTGTFRKINVWQGKLSPFVQHFVNKTSHNEPDWYVSSIKLGNLPIGYIKGSNSNASAGSSINKKEAIIKSIGEGLERYCLSNYFTIDEKFMRFVDETKSYVRCAEFEKSPKSFKINGITEKIEHSLVVNLLNNDIDYIPFEYVYLGFIRNPKIGMHTASISSGCAFYPDEITCIWKGICEIVERHVFMESWHLNFKGIKRILPEGISKSSFRERYKRIKEKGIAVNLFEISNEFDIPVVFAIISSDFFPYCACGISCNENILYATNKSIDEAISLRAMAIWNGYKKEINKESFEWVNKLEDHMELYANWKNSPIMKSLINMNCDILDLNKYKSKKKYKNITSKEDLQKISFDFKQKGYDIFYKDITMPEVEQMGKVFKVIIPQMIPLSQSYKTRWLDYFVKKGINLKTINIFPQPFS